MNVGVLALQGDVREHVEALRDLGVEPDLVKLPRDLAGLQVSSFRAARALPLAS